MACVKLDDGSECDDRRIAACLNACAAIPTEVLSYGIVMKRQIEFRKDYQELKQQRDELLTALNRLIVSANTVDGCYTRNPGNFASALAEMKQDAKAAQELVSTMEAK